MDMAPPNQKSSVDLSRMNGLDLMNAMIAGKIKPPPIADLLGFAPVKATPGVVVFEGRPAAGACNPMGSVHGGWYGAILDSALGCAILTKLPAGTGYTTLEYKVNITRAIPVGTLVRATAQTSHVGRSTGVADARMIGVEDGKTYATGSTTCIIFN